MVEAASMNIAGVNQLPDDPVSVHDDEYRHWRKAQREDPVINIVMKCINDSHPPKPLDKEVSVLLRQRKKLFLKRGVLYRRTMWDTLESTGP